MKQLTVKDFIKQLEGFNPDAIIVDYNFDDVMIPMFSWTEPSENVENPRNIAKEKAECKYITVQLCNMKKDNIQNYNSEI